MAFNAYEILSYLSRVIPLEPYVIVATGSLAGVGSPRSRQSFCKPATFVKMEIEKIGVLENIVVDEKP